MSWETSVLRQRYGHKPEFGNLPIALHMNVRRLILIGTEDDETIWSVYENVGIGLFILRSRLWS